MLEHDLIMNSFSKLFKKIIINLNTRLVFMNPQTYQPYVTWSSPQDLNCCLHGELSLTVFVKRATSTYIMASDIQTYKKLQSVTLYVIGNTHRRIYGFKSGVDQVQSAITPMGTYGEFTRTSSTTSCLNRLIMHRRELWWQTLQCNCAKQCVNYKNWHISIYRFCTVMRKNYLNEILFSNTLLEYRRDFNYFILIISTIE